MRDDPFACLGRLDGWRADLAAAWRRARGHPGQAPGLARALPLIGGLLALPAAAAWALGLGLGLPPLAAAWLALAVGAASGRLFAEGTLITAGETWRPGFGVMALVCALGIAAATLASLDLATGALTLVAAGVAARTAWAFEGLAGDTWPAALYGGLLVLVLLPPAAAGLVLAAGVGVLAVLSRLAPPPAAADAVAALGHALGLVGVPVAVALVT